AWLLLVSLVSGLFLTNSSTEPSREHYLCSTTLQTGEHCRGHETHPGDVFRPFEGLDMGRHLDRNTDMREEVPQELDAWGRAFGQFAQVASLIRPEMDRTRR